MQLSVFNGSFLRSKMKIMKITRRQLTNTIRRILVESKPKLVPTETLSYDKSMKKAWTVMVDGERIGELIKIDKMVRDGGHYSDGFAREKGWRAYSGTRPFDSRSRSYTFRNKKEALDWLLKQ